MAMLFIDSFDFYTSAEMGKKYVQNVGGAIGATSGRRGGGGFSSGIVGVLLPTNSGIVTMGAACYAGCWLCFANESQIQLGIIGNGNGGLTIWRTQTGYGNWSSSWTVNGAGYVIGTTRNGIIAAGNWYYIEVEAKLHGSTGHVIIHVNGVNEPTTPDCSSAVNTLQGGTTNILYVGLQVRADDFYVLDSSGSINNTFLGDVRVDAHFPMTPAGAHSEWTRSTGADQWATVDETAPNITDYNSTPTLNAIDTLTLENLKNSGGTIAAVQTLLYNSKSDAGPCVIAPVLRSGGTDYAGSGVAPSTDSWNYSRTVYDQNPSGPAAWDETAFNALEVGYKKTA